MKLKYIISSVTLVLIAYAASAQDDMLSMLGDSETTELVTATFKTDRVVNLQSVENTAGGELDIKIAHRFGPIIGSKGTDGSKSPDGGIYTLFGLDNATIRIGGNYGITDRLMIGGGRSSYEKTYDLFSKFKLLRQTKGVKKMPFSVCLMGGVALKTKRPSDPDRENFFSSNLYYTGQLIIGRKFSKAFSFELVPTIVHRNLVLTNAEKNDVLALGAGARFKLGKRTSLNAEYIYVLPNQLAPEYRNSLSFGFDIETGGHVFQLHFTNSTSMIEKGFVAESTGDWGAGDIHFGFNLSRTFTIK